MVGALGAIFARIADFARSCTATERFAFELDWPAAPEMMLPLSAVWLSRRRVNVSVK